MSDLARHLDIVLVDPGGFCHVDGMKVVAMEELVSFVSFELCAV
jgi:flagellar biosynthesis GTPase FlhF